MGLRSFSLALKRLFASFLIPVLGLSCPVLGYGQPFSLPSYAIQGEVLFQGQGSVYVALVDKNSFLEPEKGISHQVFPSVSTPKDESRQRGPTSLPFVFAAVPEGTYAIVAFLDENGNSRLDSGIFGPTEPWGMSFRGSRPRFRAPRFEDAMFEVPNEIRFFSIELRK